MGSWTGSHFSESHHLSINKFHKGRRVDRQKEGEDDENVKDPPEVRRAVDKLNTEGTPEGTEEMRNVQFNPITLQK
jgi:hypothetical protein